MHLLDKSCAGAHEKNPANYTCEHRDSGFVDTRYMLGGDEQVAD